MMPESADVRSTAVLSYIQEKHILVLHKQILHVAISSSSQPPSNHKGLTPTTTGAHLSSARGPLPQPYPLHTILSLLPTHNLSASSHQANPYYLPQALSFLSYETLSVPPALRHSLPHAHKRAVGPRVSPRALHTHFEIPRRLRPQTCLAFDCDPALQRFKTCWSYSPGPKVQGAHCTGGPLQPLGRNAAILETRRRGRRKAGSQPLTASTAVAQRPRTPLYAAHHQT
jgi:hypothetical protein